MFISYIPAFYVQLEYSILYGVLRLTEEIYKFDLFNFKDITKYLYIILIFISNIY